MRRWVKALVCAATVFGACGTPLFAQVGAKHSLQSYGDFNGRWEGKLSRVPTQFDAKGDPGNLTDIAFTVDGANVKVFLKGTGTWVEAKPEKFRLAYGGTNAVIFSISAALGNPSDPDGWVETWNMTITKKEPDSLFAVVVREVNNYSHSFDYDGGNGLVGRFVHVLTGEMKRVQS